MAAAFVQGQTQNGGGISTGSTIAYASNVVAGNTLIWLATIYNGNATVTDSQGNTWTRDSNTTTFSGLYKMCVFTAVAGSSGANTITVTITAGSNAYGSALLEVSGLQASPLGQIGAVQSNSTSPMSAGSITPATNGEFIVGFFNRNGNVNANYVSSGAFTFRAASPVGAAGFCTYVQTTAAAIQAEVAGDTSVGYPVLGMGISFKAAAASGHKRLVGAAGNSFALVNNGLAG